MDVADHIWHAGSFYRTINVSLCYRIATSQRLLTCIHSIQPALSILDEALHTASSVRKRCPFLFTVVCASSARYYTKKPQLYPLLVHFAKKAAASALIDGWKSVEMCQAYIILGVRCSFCCCSPSITNKEPLRSVPIFLPCTLHFNRTMHHPHAGGKRTGRTCTRGSPSALLWT